MKITPNSFYQKWKTEVEPFSFDKFTSDDILKCIEGNSQVRNRIEDILESTTEGFNCLPNLLKKISEYYLYLLGRSHLPNKLALLEKSTSDIILNENLHLRKK